MDDTQHWIEGLYRQNGPQLLIYLAQRLGAAAGAEDILHDTFAAALRDPERVRTARSPRAYLFGIARNLAASASRRSWRQIETVPIDLPADAVTPDPRLELVREAITRLKPEFREPLELRLQQELSYEEIADVLAVPVGTVRSRLHYAINELRRVLRQPQAILHLI